MWTESLPNIPEAAGLTGLEQLRGIVAGQLPQPPIAEPMSMWVHEASHGRAVFRGEPGEQHRNLFGVVHGGYAILLLDSAMGCAVYSTLPVGGMCATVSVETKLLEPLTPEIGIVVAEAQIVHRGRTQATAEGRLRALSDGTLLAHGTTTCLVREP